jgi:hypothetical protein
MPSNDIDTSFDVLCTSRNAYLGTANSPRRMSRTRFHTASSTNLRYCWFNATTYLQVNKNSKHRFAISGGPASNWEACASGGDEVMGNARRFATPPIGIVTLAPIATSSLSGSIGGFVSSSSLLVAKTRGCMDSPVAEQPSQLLIPRVSTRHLATNGYAYDSYDTYDTHDTYDTCFSNVGVHSRS